MMGKKYLQYFDIDPKYYAAVTADLIKQGQVKWQHFYPHDTFVKLLEKTHRVISGQMPLSLWVEGAYGTGKSHAALTIKSLLEATDDEVRAYFEEYELSKDLCNKLIADKSNSELIAVHRIGSSDINSDRDLAVAVQASIMASLRERGINNLGEASLRDAALKWLEEDACRAFLGSLIAKEKYSWAFSGKSIEDVVGVLKDGDDDQISDVMKNIVTIAEDNGISALRLNTEILSKWIKSVVRENKLTILFIWDEFTEYFQNNQNSLTGFQTLVEISESDSFYFMVVSHESRSLFRDAETAKKILGRFVDPVRIELPENMAFELMAQAMRTTSDPQLSVEWETYSRTLNDGLSDVRNEIVRSAKVKIDDNELQKIVPLHPYAALLLKHISVVFNSNQRSMFDFIISNDMEDAKGFKWFITEHGPLDSSYNILTIDMLWDFFYGKGQGSLNDNVRVVLDAYSQIQTEKLSPDECRVLKTVLLLQAISLRVSDVDLLKPTEQNIDLAFRGTDWNIGQGSSIARKLESDGLISQKQVGGGKFEYVVVGAVGDRNAIDQEKQKVAADTKTQDLIINGSLIDALAFPEKIARYFEIRTASAKNFSKELGSLIGSGSNMAFKVLLTFAKNDEEADILETLLLRAAANNEAGVIFVNAGLTPMGKDLYEQYVDNTAYCSYYRKNDKQQAQVYDQAAKRNLEEWRQHVTEGPFMLYGPEWVDGQRQSTLAIAQDTLAKLVRKRFPDGLFDLTLTSQMYKMAALAQGAQCGLEQKLAGQYKSANAATRLDNAFAGAWQTENYWIDSPNLAISKIKNRIEGLIADRFTDSGRAGLSDVASVLAEAPYGVIPSSLAAFTMGFVLKEYCTPNYYWSDGSTSEPMSVEKLKIAIDLALKHQENPALTYKESYIVAMSNEMKAFLDCTSQIFHIDKSLCSSLESAREYIRLKMKELSFPIWYLEPIAREAELESDPDKVILAIRNYCGIANNERSGTAQKESGLASEIGKITMETPGVVQDLQNLVTSDNCRKGVLVYLKSYCGGELPRLASDLDDQGRLAGEVKKKFNSDAANWVWNEDTANSRIDEVIIEYRIACLTKKVSNAVDSYESAISFWRERSRHIKISCEALKEISGNIPYPFLLKLKDLAVSNGVMGKDEQSNFYDSLKAFVDDFNEFYGNQVHSFSLVCKDFLGGLSDEDIATLFNQNFSDTFMIPESAYYQQVDSAVKKHVSQLAKTKLAQAWKEKTGTKSPSEWSAMYRTPVACMFDLDNREYAKGHLDTMNDPNPADDRVEAALQFIAETDFAPLQSDAERDKRFMKSVVGDYEILLSDPNKVRDALDAIPGLVPYRWIDNGAVSEKVKELARKEYKTTGSYRAASVVEGMDTEERHEFIKGLIADNMAVGIEILRKLSE